MFTIKIENSKVLKGIVETLAGIIDETTITITKETFTILAMDPSRICLLKLVLKKESFDEYKCEQDEKFTVNLEDFDKILKRSTTNDSIELELAEKEQKLKVKMKRQDGSSRTRTFSLALLDLDTEEIPIDNLLEIDFPSQWGFEPEILVEAIKDAEIYSENLNVKAEEGKGLFFNSSGQIGEMNYEIELSDLLEPNISGTNTGAYSLEFLKKILKLSSITEKLEISLKTDHPLRMKFNLLEGGELYHFLAPRVNESEYEDTEEDIIESEPLTSPEKEEKPKEAEKAETKTKSKRKTKEQQPKDETEVKDEKPEPEEIPEDEEAQEVDEI